MITVFKSYVLSDKHCRRQVFELATMCLLPQAGGDSIYGGKFNDEKPALKLKHDAAGILSMANSGKNSNTSQFFLTLAPAPQCDGKHVVLGRVVSGLDILQRISMSTSYKVDGRDSMALWSTACLRAC